MEIFSLLLGVFIGLFMKAYRDALPDDDPSPFSPVKKPQTDTLSQYSSIAREVERCRKSGEYALFRCGIPDYSPQAAKALERMFRENGYKGAKVRRWYRDLYRVEIPYQ